MAAQGDPYKILGISRTAGLHEIKQAYRQVVRKYHPDTCLGDAKEASARFHELTDAYHAVMAPFRTHGANPPPRVPRYTPQDIARMSHGVSWRVVSEDQDDEIENVPWRGHAITQRHILPSRNEPFLLMLCAAGAILLGWAATVLTGTYILDLEVAEDLSTAGVVVLFAVGLGVYAVLLAGAIGLLILSRKIVVLVLRLGLFTRKALPRPRNKLPKS